MQGLAHSAAKIYENAIIAVRGRNGWKAYMKSPGIRFAAILLNFHFQCLTLLFFSQADCQDAWQLLRNLVTAMTGYGA